MNGLVTKIEELLESANIRYKEVKEEIMVHFFG